MNSNKHVFFKFIFYILSFKWLATKYINEGEEQVIQPFFYAVFILSVLYSHSILSSITSHC